MVSWKLVYTKQAQKDAKKLASSGLKANAQELLQRLSEGPYRKRHPWKISLKICRVPTRGASTYKIASCIQ